MFKVKCHYFMSLENIHIAIFAKNALRNSVYSATDYTFLVLFKIYAYKMKFFFTSA